MKKILIVMLLAASFSSAAYAATPTSVAPQTTVSANSGPNKQDTNVQTTSNAAANNGGQSLTYAPVYQTPADTTANIVQNVTGTQTVINRGETTSNVNYGGTQTQNVVQSGGTDSTIRQEFGTQKIKNTPSVSGPPLTSSNDTCMGSASGSVNAPGFGLSVGKTYTDDNCVMLKNSRELWNMGMKAASMALMCMDRNNREALEMTGFECPQTARAAGRTTAN